MDTQDLNMNLSNKKKGKNLRQNEIILNFDRFYFPPHIPPTDTKKKI